MDSSGLAAIVFCFQMTDIKENLAIFGVQERVGKLFRMTHMHHVVRIFKNLEEALKALDEEESSAS
jgi:anti-anti-sigma factor